MRASIVVSFMLVLGCSDTTSQSAPAPPPQTSDTPDGMGETVIPDTTVTIPDGIQEVAPDEGTEPKEGEFGWPCEDASDCDSGYCVTSDEGLVCTQTCFDECPDGWSCKQVTNTGEDITFICIYGNNELCRPCYVDADCDNGNLASPHRCLTLGEAGSFCGLDCSGGGLCPPGYLCTSVPGEDGTFDDQCTPVTGECPCVDLYDGLTTTCARQGANGTCLGERVCDGEVGAWTPCDAEEPVAEICDGEDNDCSGIVDDNLPTEPCEQSNEFGTCQGKLACVAPDFGCDAKVPTEEFCDLEDNDCDGQTDEDFGTVTCGFGVCEHTVELCAQGQFVQCDPLEGAGVEVCNELDDDCDGSTDEIDDVGTTSCGLGVCLQTVSGCEECDPYAGAVDEEPGMATSCDGLDNDCNGETDDYWPEVGLACDGSDSDSCENGVWTCTENGTGVACAGDDSNSVEICNGFDDDCNGTPDDGLGTTTCGFGICEHTVDNCSNGQDQVCDSMEGAQASDLPDASFQDTNCDGIDGDESRAVFVDGYAGNDSNPGTKTSPVKTLSKALQKASANAKNQVLVSAGSYSGQVVLKNGVGIFGGYNAATGWTRSPGNAVQLVGSSKVVVATNISATTELALLTITASNNTATGGSSYGVFSKNSSGLVLRNCTITGGNGGSGSSGSNGSIGSSGNTGTKGNPGCEDGGSLFCSDCNPPGAGAGASSSCGGSGGNGGLSGKGGSSGKNGGTPSGGGVGGQGGSAGKSGSTGGSAPNASGGSGGSGGNSIGSAGSNGYGSAGGGSGSQGANAKGGGGGGGGGGDDPGFAECNTWGGTGGGGGSGGCGGTGGSGGGGGGGSFGVYIYAGSVSLIDCTVVSMTGGAGGAAGAGGTGGSGGNGGNGGTGGDEDATNGGKGGKGGKGGNGGHGGGGGGGPSIGILCGGGGAVSTSNTSIQTGTAGPAGTSPGNNGKTGKVSNKWGC